MSQKNPIWYTFSPMPAINYGGKFINYEKLIFLNMFLCIRYLKGSPLTQKHIHNLANFVMSQKNLIWDTFSPMPALNYGGKFTNYEKLIFLNMLLCIRYLKSSPLTPKPYPHPGKFCYVSEKSNLGYF